MGRYLPVPAVAGTVLAMADTTRSPVINREQDAPVLADVDGMQLRWHLRGLRGHRTLTDVAREVGIRSDELGRIERGETTQIRFSTLLRILKGYRCDIADLLEVEDATGAAQPRYGAALRAYRAGKLSHPGRRAEIRSLGRDEQDLDEAAAVAEEPVVRRQRGAVGSLRT